MVASAASDPLDGENWVSLNGTVSPLTAGVTARTGLQIAQFTSIANVPQIRSLLGRHAGQRDDAEVDRVRLVVRHPERRRRAGARRSDDDGLCEFNAFAGSCFVWDVLRISPYRMADGGAFFFNNQSITNGST